MENSRRKDPPVQDVQSEKGQEAKPEMSLSLPRRFDTWGII